MTDAHPAIAVARRFVDAIERGDLAALNDSFAAEALIWHNTDRRWQTKAENSVAAQAFFDAFSSRKYSVERLEPLSDGAVLQFVAHLVRTDGRTLDWPGCAIFEVRDGRTVRLMEYIDAASFVAAVG